MTTRVTLILLAGLILIGLAYLLTPSPAPLPPVAPPTAAPPAASVQQPVPPAPAAEAPSPAEPEEPPLPVTVKQVKCVKIVEPYVILTDGGETIRLLGLKLPDVATTEQDRKYIVESQASAMENRNLRLEIITEVGSDGRLLAYAYYSNRIMANRQIIARGLAAVDPVYLPKKILDPLLKMEQAARQKKTGLWQRD